MLAEKLHGTDPEDVILDAFKEFDENNTGFIPKVPFTFIKFHKIHKKFTTATNITFFTGTSPRTKS